jgi:hypothetical protein
LGWGSGWMSGWGVDWREREARWHLQQGVAGRGWSALQRQAGAGGCRYGCSASMRDAQVGAPSAQEPVGLTFVGQREGGRNPPVGAKLPHGTAGSTKKNSEVVSNDKGKGKEGGCVCGAGEALGRPGV